MQFYSTSRKLADAVAVRRVNARRRRLEEMARLGVVQPKDHKIIPILRGCVTLVDNCDYEAANEYFWIVTAGYASTTIKKKTVYLHRWLMECPDSMQIDHINRNKLDNRRANLRICTQRENNGNAAKRCNARTSKYKGVSICRGRYYAFGKENGKSISLGSSHSEIEAAEIYNAWAARYFGGFALLNVTP